MTIFASIISNKEDIGNKRLTLKLQDHKAFFISHAAIQVFRILGLSYTVARVADEIIFKLIRYLADIHYKNHYKNINGNQKHQKS